MSVLPPSASSPSSGFDINGPLTSGGLLTEEIIHSSAELPAYSVPAVASPQQTEHVISLTVSEKNSHEWLKLKVKSWSPSAKHLPSFVEGTPIMGTVELDLPKYDSIKAIAISVKGFVVSSGIDQLQFMEVSKTLWVDSMGDPRRLGHQSQAQYTDKLIGQYSFPYSINIPKKVNFTNKRHIKDLQLSGNENLPPSLCGRSWGSLINYELSVDIKRRGILNVGSTLKTLLGYTPISRPEPPSQLIQEAFREASSLLGPDTDPDGWEVMQNIDVEGTVFNTRKATVKCDLALAKPLTYTKGSFIPCYLTLSCDDDQALDLVSKPDALILQMRRKMKARIGVEDSDAALVLPGNEGNNYLSKASWTPVNGRGSGKVTLYGELALPNNLTPSFQFGNFEVKYVVDMYPFTVTGFTPDSQARLLRTEVAITSGYALGPRPISRLPPGYNLPPRSPGLEASGRLFSTDLFL